MRRVALAVCGLLLSATMAVAAPSAERAALLERLRQALPVLAEIISIEDMAASTLRDELLEQNPGKEKVVAPIAKAYGACVAKLMGDTDYVAEAVAKADAAGMTDAELRTLIAYYEDPELKALFKLLGPAMNAGKDLDVSPATRARLEAASNDPAVVRFTALINEEPAEVLQDDAMMKGLMACAGELAENVDKAGLSLE